MLVNKNKKRIRVLRSRSKQRSREILCDDIIGEIFSYFEWWWICRFQRVSKQFNRIAKLRDKEKDLKLIESLIEIPQKITSFDVIIDGLERIDAYVTPGS